MIARSLQLALEQYETDKVPNGYLTSYDEVFASLIWDPIVLLEIGVFKGGSLKLWRDYFPNASVVGVDMQIPRDVFLGERIQVFEGDQSDLAFLTSVATQIAPHGFDIIIDDASHIGSLTRTTFWHLFERHLKPHGFYVIEDWGTGYWSDWPDGERAVRHSESLWRRIANPWFPHNSGRGAGMVTFIKELVDEQGAADLTRGRLHGSSSRWSKFERLLVLPSIVFVRKAGAR